MVALIVFTLTVPDGFENVEAMHKFGQPKIIRKRSEDFKGSALPADPKIQQNESYETNVNQKIKKLILLEGFSKADFKFEISAFLYVGNHVPKLMFDFFGSKCQFSSLKPLRNIWFCGFEALGLCSNDFSKRQASDFISQTQTRHQKVQKIDELGAKKVQAHV